MPRNLEIKLEISPDSDLKSKILKNGGQYTETLHQKDTYYVYSNGLLKLRVQNGTFQLIKYIRNEDFGNRWSDYSILEIKGNKIEDYLMEIFQIDIIVEKTRDLYIYKNTRIHLDDVQHLGRFIELETVTNNISETSAIYEFNEIISFLKLNKEEEIRNSYRDLLKKKIKKSLL
jgi:predicted adenylyl cyclase CyaB